jgi:hypothetical protein
MGVVPYRTDDVPWFAVNEMDYVVRRKPWRDPTLQTAVAEQEKEDEGEQRGPPAPTNKNQGKKKENEDNKNKNAARGVGDVSSCNNAAYER